MRDAVRPPYAVGMRDLTPREISVLELLGEGRGNREIGRSLSITEGTVKGHVHRILAKLGLSNRTEAALAAFRMPRLHRKLEGADQRPVDVDG